MSAGDVALGYDLATSNISDAELERYLDKGMSLPDVVLVRTRLLSWRPLTLSTDQLSECTCLGTCMLYVGVMKLLIN